ncbi:STAS domain-containing protein [Streptomyces jeddahensis]|uniref:Anti-sigma factor antagonist n=1 Tax=Streptomyces jeddahensis TaxID=1716141 RepID=A0A177HKM2_9ACTN|nr:STAS domain-containing protein [Streptomyces jeddahensis]OAH11306.1 putative anti-sigma factor antagonist [Streptomyces jeddahensis]
MAEKDVPVYDTMHVDLKATGPGRCQVTVTGELDVATTGEARTILRTALDGYRHIVVDLSGLRFCDCSGLSALLAAARNARTVGVELRLRAVPRTLARILRLTGTHRAFTIESVS